MTDTTETDSGIVRNTVPDHVEWSQRLEIGIPQIDEQHKRFFSLAASFEGNGDEIRVMMALSQLNEYVKTHFREEELQMATCHYPGIKDHHRLHVEFRGMLASLLESARKMTLDEIAAEVKLLINGWLYDHILTADLDYVPYINNEQRVRYQS